MEIFINPISSNIDIFVIDDVEVRQKITLTDGDDFDRFPESIVEMLEKYKIDEIWCIVGPGRFTRMRIITLSLSSIYLTYSIGLKGCHFFRIIKGGFPVLKINEREYLVGTSTGSTNIFTMSKLSKLSKKVYIGYGDKNDFTEGKKFIEYTYDFSHIRNIFKQEKQRNILTPIYFKEPHITGSKKKTYPS